MALLGSSYHPGRSYRRWEAGLWLRILALAVASLWGTGRANAQEIRAAETEIKAAFLYNFTKLVTWPTNAFPTASAPLVVGVIGKDPFGPALDAVLKEKVVQSRRVIAVRCKSLEEIKTCHVLYVGELERLRLARLWDELAGRPILTVGDGAGFAERGMIGLVRSDSTISLRINRAAAERAGLDLSSRLLRLDKNLKPEADRAADQAPVPTSGPQP